MIASAQTIATAAQTKANKEPDTYAEILPSLDVLVNQGAQVLLQAQAVHTAIQQASSQVTGATAKTPTVLLASAVDSVQEAQGTASQTSAQVVSWESTAEALAIEFPTLAVDLGLAAINTSIAKAQGPAEVAAGQVDAAVTAANWWQAAANEDDLRSDAGVLSTGQQVLQDLQQAIDRGQELEAQSLSDDSVIRLDTELAQLVAAQGALTKVLNDVRQGNELTKDPLSPHLSKLSAQVAALMAPSAVATAATAQVTAGNSSGAELLFDWLADNLSAELGLQLVADLLTAVEPLDQAMETATQAMTAAGKATVAAQMALQEARLAILAGLEDQSDSRQVMVVEAANPGVWGNSLQVEIVRAPKSEFDVTVREMGLRNGRLVTLAHESYHGLTLADATAANYAPAVVNHTSKLIELEYQGLHVPGTRPQAPEDFQDLEGGRDGGPPGASDLYPVTASDGGGLTGAVEKMKPSLFNILCLPVVATYSSGAMATAIDDSIALAAKNRAFFIADIPANVNTVSAMENWMNLFGNDANYSAAVYYPRLLVPDPLSNYRNRNVGPSGTLAGIYAGNDQNFGVWKAPAGIQAVIENAELASLVTDEDDGKLNPLGVNALRNFKTYGNVVWGARTLAGADLLGSEWKYINVRRLADFIEDSLHQSLKWAVFQDNDERLWAQISTEVGSFMSGLFAAGAFQGTSASQAFLVKCDKSTTTATDIDKGIVNVLVGFAPVKPAEFVIVQIQQLAGQSQAS